MYIIKMISEYSREWTYPSSAKVVSGLNLECDRNAVLLK